MPNKGRPQSLPGLMVRHVLRPGGVDVIVITDAQQQGRGNEVQNEGRPAITDERQRDADDGKTVRDHGHIDQALAAEGKSDAHGQEHAEPVLTGTGRLDAEINQGQEYDQDQDSPQEAPFLADDGIGKVRMGFGQITELADARPHPLAPDTAGTDGDEALIYLIADCLLIGIRTPPGPDAVFLIIMGKEIKGQTDDGQGHNDKHEYLPPRPMTVIEGDAAANEHQYRRYKKDDSRAGIRLEHDNGGQDQRWDETEQTITFEKPVFLQ